MSERIVLLHSELTYAVETPTTLLLQVAAMHTDRQTIKDELLTVNPHTPVDYLQTGPLGNRASRLSLQPGLLPLFIIPQPPHWHRSSPKMQI